MTETLTGFAALAMIGFLIGFAGLMLFMVLVQPVWCLIDCAVDTRRPGPSKAVWIVVLVALYGVANWFYGAFAADGRWLRLLTRLAWLFTFLLAAAFVAMYSMNEGFKRGIEREWHRGRDLVVLVEPAAPLR